MVVGTDEAVPNDEEDGGWTTSEIVLGYIRLCVHKIRRKLSEDQVKYLLPDDQTHTSNGHHKLLSHCCRTIMAEKSQVVQLMALEWRDIIEDITNLKLSPREVQIKYNMLMRHWLVEGAEQSWDKIIMCIAFTNHYISSMLKQTKDAFRAMDLARWCVDFLTSKMGAFIARKGWRNFLEEETEWLTKKDFDISFVNNPLKQAAFTQLSQEMPPRKSKTKNQASSKERQAVAQLTSETISLETCSYNNIKTETDLEETQVYALQQQLKIFQQVSFGHIEKQEHRIKYLEVHLSQLQDQVQQLHRQHLILQQQITQGFVSQTETPKPADQMQYILTPVQLGNSPVNNCVGQPFLLDSVALQQQRNILLGSQSIRSAAVNPLIPASTVPSQQQQNGLQLGSQIGGIISQGDIQMQAAV